MADAFWLARQMAPVVPLPPRPEEEKGIGPDGKHQADEDIAGTETAAPQPAARETDTRSPYAESDEGGVRRSTAVGVYRPSRRKASSAHGIGFRVPGVPALPNALEITLALRPLLHRTTVRGIQVLDEEATVRRIVEERIFLPVYAEARSRWAELAFVVDASPSMHVWEPTVAELRRLLERHGAFRDVRIWGLDTAGGAGRTRLWSGSRYGSHGGERRFGELQDPGGRRLVLVVSDCVAPGWRDGRLADVLQGWGRRSPLALLQVLPSRMWPQGPLGLPPLKLSSTRPVVPNPQLRVETLRRETEADRREVPLPILSLDPASVSRWARVVAGQGGVWVPGVRLSRFRPHSPRLTQRQEDDTDDAEETLDARERLRRFGLVASGPARELATYLATMELTLPVMRLVQQLMLPKSRHLHLAEVLLGGLLTRTRPEDEPTNPDDVEYEFADPELRNLLLEGRTGEEVMELTERVLAETSRFVASQEGRPAGISAALRDTKASGPLALPIGSRPFATLAAHALRRYGGEFERLAERLERGLETAPELDLRPLAMLRSYGGAVGRFAWSPDGELLASPSLDGTVRIWTARGEEHCVLKVPGAGVNQVSWSPDGQRLACCTMDGALRIWDTATWRVRRSLHEAADAALVSLDWSPDAAWIAGGTAKGGLFVWPAETGAPRATPLGRTIRQVAWSGDWVAVCTGAEVVVWDARLWRRVARFPRNPGPPRCATWSSMGELMMIGTEDGDIAVWRVRQTVSADAPDPTPEPGLVRVLAGHDSAVECLSLDRSEQILASKGADGTVRLWRTDQWRCIAVIPEVPSGRDYPGVAFHPRLPRLASPGEDGRSLRLWDVDYRPSRGIPTPEPVIATTPPLARQARVGGPAEGTVPGIVGRVVEVKGAAEGSGFLISPRLILTAWHVVQPLAGAPPSETVQVRILRNYLAAEGADRLQTRPARLIWPPDEPGDDFDFALLLVNDESTGPDDSPVSWADLPASSVVEVKALGFAGRTPFSTREVCTVVGTVSPGSGSKARQAYGRNTFDIVPRPEGMAIGWEGMSGAPVFSGTALVGVVIGAAERRSLHWLKALPVARLFRRNDVREALRGAGLAVPPQAVKREIGQRVAEREALRLQHFRIFLSSPGDVAEERRLASKVIDGTLRKDPAFRDRLQIECVTWDGPDQLRPHEAASRHLPKPSECDIVVVILWTRMGTPLPPEYHKPGGAPYISGTEWECEDALGSDRDPPPDVLVYRRTGMPTIGLENPGDPEIQEALEQRLRVARFFARFRNPDGSLRGGVTEYDAPSTFINRLELDLRNLIERRLQRRAPAAPGAVETGEVERPVPSWSGPPYPGLRPFEAEEAAIFFGREREVEVLIARLRNPAQRFLAVVGASGSGKSSLVRAGLLPRLKDGAVEDSQHWRVLAFTPGVFGGDPLLALASELKNMLPAAVQKSQIEIATALAEAPRRLADYAGALLVGRPAGAALVLFVDQFEELFTFVPEERRGAFVELLSYAANDPRMRVLATLRADFLPQCAAEPALATLLQAGTFVLGPPGPAALADMIRRPAEWAGLALEESFVDEVLRDAIGEPGEALPLVAFCLEELYRRTAPEHRLTLGAYRAIDGLQGTIGRRAGELLEQIGHTEKASLDAALPQVFRALVRVDAAGKPTRQRAFRDGLMSVPAPIPQLIETLIEGRLLLADNSGGRATVMLAYEALLQEWPALREWLERDLAQMQRVQRILLLLASPEAKDRRYAAEAMGEIGPAAPEVVPVLAAALGDTEAGVRRAAAEALGRIGPAASEAVPVLAAALGDVSEFVREAATAALELIEAGSS